jgi:hypothetical protein
MRGAGKKWDKATIEAVFLSMKTGRVREKNSRARDYASMDVFHCINRLCNLSRGHVTLGDDSPVAFEANTSAS